MKSLLDVPEGGCIKDTRWRPATIPKDMPRLLALNGSVGSYGAWFSRFEQYGISLMMDALAEATDPRHGETERERLLTRAAKTMKSISPDEQAAARRVAVGFAYERLVTEDTVTALKADTNSKAVAGKARRAAYWAQQC